MFGWLDKLVDLFDALSYDKPAIIFIYIYDDKIDFIYDKVCAVCGYILVMEVGMVDFDFLILKIELENGTSPK